MTKERVADAPMNYHMLIQAFINNGLPERDAWDAAYLYRNVDLHLDGESQADYDKAVKEDMDCWEI